ncbi:GPI-anchored small secreted protein [Mycena amicta]|nr:GPI-anchored small secreted protein [Mycena amicta]
MFKSLLLAVVFVASTVSAFTVTSPGTGQNFTTDGSNTVAWTMVPTDRSNFTIVLSNGNPAEDEELKALVQASDGTTTVDPPAQGWPAPGSQTWRINLVQDSENLDTILAQSSQFTFAAPKVTATSSSSSSTATLATVQTPATTSETTTTSAQDASPTDTTTTPVTNSSGAAAFGANTALISAFVLLSLVLA